MTTSPQDRAAEAFAAELARWRIERGLSKKQLASEMGVDPYPSEPERSNRFYREHPLTWEELDLTATFGSGPGERMRLRPIYDRDSFKEIWLLFENDQGRFPLYRGQRVTITYAYRVGED